ncbi:hypothetical protein [Bradyrhizobium sp. Tv2a-2]|uniref:hypothetical protein n=1 Tax=Bradyrhizobium sp. Tv2a-2 TaxID=113395 RepID=UPI000410F340|nr:hypothetical protein [Bradyrhizobium sp. Tv2a-2]
MSEDGLKVERAMALIQEGHDRSTVAHLMGYASVQSVHNLIYEGKERQKWRAKVAVNPALDRKFKNVERVRKYMEENVGCLKKQIMLDLCLSQHTVERAIRIINEGLE